jgi:outer membrane lipoprotein SlyB
MRNNLLALALSAGMFLGVVTDAGAATVVHHSGAYYAAQARARQRARRARAVRARSIRHRRHVNTARRVGFGAAGGAAIGALAGGGKGAGIGAIAGAGAGALYDQHQKHRGRQ